MGGGSHGPSPLGFPGRAAVVRYGPDSRRPREQWSLRDVAPMVREHFGMA